MRDDTSYRPSVKHRVIFYLGGVVFASATYLVGLWLYALESSGAGDVDLYRRLVRDLFGALGIHLITLFAWQLTCVVIAYSVGTLITKEVHHRKLAEERANIDGVTEIYNHRHYQERLAGELERARRYGRSLSLVMLDLDDFKAFNDTWGHQEGDKLLRWFGGVCQSCIRSTDVLARYGGEEFMIVLPEANSAEALAVAERIRVAAEKRSREDFGENKVTTVSGGVASFPEHGSNRHALTQSADAALYYAKQQGRNRCFVYEESSHRSYRVVSNHVRPVPMEDDMGALEALGATIDARDHYTRGHSANVMRFSMALGEKAGLSAEEMENLRAASLLHDIGRIGTPEELFGKPGRLSPEEWKLVENHALVGSRILKRVQQMGSIVPAVLHHHERYDGEGYPSGLAGANIPLAARIIAIADSYDAMTSDRSYRLALSYAGAIEELRRCAGMQFDPELVELFIKCLAESRNEKAA